MLAFLLVLGLVASGQAAYNYNHVLRQSILFFEAQRSGDLPSANRIPYRDDSALGDKGNNNEDLTGGWYDAGDMVKFGLPMATSATLLAWGVIEFEDSYRSAGEYNNALDSIKWATDYFMKCHVSPNEFYVQVGDGNADHAFWGRPEEMTMWRPSYKLTTSKPGSDAAGATAAAMAAASIAFKKTDWGYSNELLQHAKDLFNFADTFRGKYSDSIPEARNFYSSSSYNDDLGFAAAWLYRANNDGNYLTKAINLYQSGGLSGTPWALSWDDTKAGVQMLMYQVTNSNEYKEAVERFLNSWMQGGGITYTPKGLAWRDTWGPLRYTANTAFIAAMACNSNGINDNRYCTFVKDQLGYMLGNTGRSFVVGFGNNPPQRPHHRSSSCPDRWDSNGNHVTCDWNAYNNAGPNPQVLFGALVGGPDKWDNYQDDRSDYISNEVACDYNAGFQSAIAGIIKLVNDGKVQA